MKGEVSGGLQGRLQQYRGVLLIMLLTVAVFLLDTVTDRAITEFGAKSYHIWSGQLYRLIVATFLHGGLMHIASNLYALYIFGPVTESVLGTKRFLVLYLLSGAIGYIVSLLAAPGILAVGASASIFGLMGYTLHFRLRRLPRRWLPIDTGFLQIFAINLLVAQTVSNIDQWAHLGGLLGGILSAGLLGFERQVMRPRFRRRESATAAVLLAALFFVGLRPLDTAHLVQGFAPRLSGTIQERYASYFLPYAVTGSTMVWKYVDEAGDWDRVGEPIEANRYASLSLLWRWERGVNYKPGSTMQYQVVWRHNGQVVASSSEEIETPGVYYQTLSPMLGAALEGSWSVSIIADGRNLARVAAHVATTR